MGLVNVLQSTAHAFDPQAAAPIADKPATAIRAVIVDLIRMLLPLSVMDKQLNRY